MSGHLVHRAQVGEMIQLEQAEGEFVLPVPMPRKLLLVTAGSGIAMGLPQNWVARGALAANPPVQSLPAVSGRMAVVSGSCSLATQAQVRHFRDRGGPVIISC